MKLTARQIRRQGNIERLQKEMRNFAIGAALFGAVSVIVVVHVVFAIWGI